MNKSDNNFLMICGLCCLYSFEIQKKYINLHCETLNYQNYEKVFCGNDWNNGSGIDGLWYSRESELWC